MPWGIQTDFARQTLPKPEIVSYPIETTVIDSVVVSARGVTADTEGPYTGRRYLLSGTILSRKEDGQYERYVKGAGQAVAGILFDTVEFGGTSAASDEPVAMVRRNVSFQSSKIVDFEDYENDVKSALTTCEFV